MKGILLQDCPDDLRKAAEKRMSEQPWPWELLSVTVHELTPHIDKTETLTNYEVVLCKSNTFFILSRMDDGKLFHSLSESMFTLGTLKRILETAPAWMGLTAAAASVSG